MAHLSVKLLQCLPFRSLIVCFSAISLQATPQLRLSSSTVGPVIVQAGSNAQSQVINASNMGDGTLSLSIISTTASWLIPSVGAPTTCSNGPCVPININFNTNGLAIGTYTESFTVTDPNAIDAPQTVNVTVQVNGTPTSFDFYVTPNNGSSTAQSGMASTTINTGGTVISSAKTNDSYNWLNFALFGGNHVLYTAWQLRATSQPGQPEGTYTGTVILSGSLYASDNKTINVTLHVTSQPILQIPASPITFNVVQGQSARTTSVTFQNIGLGSLSVSGVTTTGGSWLRAATAGGSSVGVTADPGSLTPGSYFGAVTLASNAANTSVAIPVRVNVTPAGNPITFFNGVVDNAAFASGQPVAAGSIADVFGSQLSSGSPAYASGFPLPTTLGGVQVLINGTPVPLIYADANQVDFQVPFNLAPGQVTVQVLRNSQPGNRISANVVSAAPRLFALKQLAAAPDGTPYGVVVNSDNTLAIPSNLGVPAHPAHRGDLVTIYVLGLGPVSPVVNTGDAAPSAEPLARTADLVQGVYGTPTGTGSPTVNAIYAGLSPGFAGLYQVNVLIPQSVPLGNVPVMILTGAHVSNVVEISVAAQ